MRNTIESARLLQSRIGAVKILHENTTVGIRSLRQEHKKLETMREVIDLSREYYQRAVEIMYEESLKEVEEVVNASLKYIFWDKQFSMKFQLGDRRAKTLEFVLYDSSYSPPLEVDVKDSIGKGVRTVVSFVIDVYFVINKGAARIVFIDEHYGHVSDQYQDRFFQFVRSLAKEKKVKVIMISHEETYRYYADRTYYVSDGHAALFEEGEKVENSVCG